MTEEIKTTTKTPQQKVEEMYNWMKEIKDFMDAMKLEFAEEKKVKEAETKKPKEDSFFDAFLKDIV